MCNVHYLSACIFTNMQEYDIVRITVYLFHSVILFFK